MRRCKLLLGIVVVAAACMAFAAVPVGASALAAPPCHATMSNTAPRQYTTTDVNVASWSYTSIRTVAHYKTTTTTHYGETNGHGKASIWYYISGATIGYRVVVDVTVTKDGRSGSCSTSFVPAG